MSLEHDSHDQIEHVSPVEKMEADGWVIIGHEGLTITKFSADAKFVPVPYQTEQSIKSQYLQKLQQAHPGHKFEIALVLNENTQSLTDLRRLVGPEEYQQFLNNPEDKDKNFIVFARELSE